MFRDVPACSGMFRNVPCSMFHVPGFIDARKQDHAYRIIKTAEMLEAVRQYFCGILHRVWNSDLFRDVAIT